MLLPKLIMSVVWISRSSSLKEPHQQTRLLSWGLLLTASMIFDDVYFLTSLITCSKFYFPFLAKIMCIWLLMMQSHILPSLYVFGNNGRCLKKYPVFHTNEDVQPMNNGKVTKWTASWSRILNLRLIKLTANGETNLNVTHKTYNIISPTVLKSS